MAYFSIKNCQRAATWTCLIKDLGIMEFGEDKEFREYVVALKSPRLPKGHPTLVFISLPFM